MLNDEFQKWLENHLDAFPDLRAWLSGLDATERTLGVWMGVLSDVDPADAAHVTRLMARGEIEPPAAYAREQTAAIVRKQARLLRYAREATQQEPAESNPFASGRMPLGPHVRRAMALGTALLEERISRDDHDRQLAEVLAQSGQDPKASEPRFFCRICLDQGVVVVWHDACVREVKATGKRPKRRLAATVACSCARGTHYANPPQAKPGQRSFRALPVYDEAFYCKVASGSPGMRDDASLIEWVLGSEDKNRIKSFDEWNAGVLK